MASEQIKNLITDKISGEWGEEAILGEGVRIIRTANFTNLGVINYDKVVYRNVDERKVNQKKLKKGDIIIEKSGGSPNQPVGRVVYFDLDTQENYLCNNFTTILRPDRNKVHPKYLFYQLFIGHIKGKTLKYQNKTTGIINLKLDNYLNERINISPIEDQIRIATILSKAEVLIKQRKESIALLDEFLKSTFLEMFGDPVRNDKGWEKKRFAKILKIKHGFAFKSEYFSNKGEYKLLTPMNFNEEGGYIEKKDKQKYYVGSFPEDYILEENNLLVAMTEQAHGLLGSAIKVPNNGIFLHNQRLGLVVFDNNKLSTNFLFYLFNSIFVRRIIDSKATGTKVRHTSPSKIEEISVGIPHFTLQTQFAQIVEKTEAIKKQYQASLEELEQLFGSLSQRAFKGELDLSQVEIEEEEENLDGGFVNVEEAEPALQGHNNSIITHLDEESLVKTGKNYAFQDVKDSTITINVPSHSKIVISKIRNLELQKLQLGHEDSSKYKVLIQYFEENEYINFSDLYEKMQKYQDFNYEQIKDFVMKGLTDEKPYFEQVFDSETKEIKHKLL